MAQLTSEANNQLRRVLLNCGPFADQRTLRALFADTRIEPWRAELPDGASPGERVDLLINHLHNRFRTDSGDNALLLFLQVLKERIDPADACHAQIADLIQRLAAGSDLVELVEAASQKVVVYNSAPIVARPPELFGRQALLEEMDLITAEGKSVLLFGLAGSGKTALAAVAAERYLTRFQKPVIWLECGRIEADVAFYELAQRFGTDEERRAVHLNRGDGDVHAVRKMLSGYPGYLLVLDNVWNGPALFEMLRAVPESMPVIVTSRTAFAYGINTLIGVDELENEAALALLSAHAGRDLDEREAALELCARLSNLAYALEIAGTLLKGGRRTVTQLLRRTPHALEVPGKASIQGLLEQSLETLEGTARDMFRMFGALSAPGATPEFLAALARVHPNEALAALDKLDAHSLARNIQDGGGSLGVATAGEYFRLHDITFSYARELFNGAGGDPQQLVLAARAYLSEHDGDAQKVHLDLPNLLAAARLAQRDDPGSLIEIVRRLTLHGYADRRGYNLDLLNLLAATVAAVRAQPQAAEQLHFLLGKLGNAYFSRGDAEKALAAYQEALALAPDAHRAALLEAIVGKAYGRLRNHEKAALHFRRARERAAATGEDMDLLLVLEQQSLALSYAEDYGQIRELAHQQITLGERLGDRIGQAYAHINLGSAELLGYSNAQSALAHHTRARTIGEEVGDRFVMAYALFGMAKDYDALDEREQVPEYLDRAESLFRSLGHLQYGRDVQRYRETHGYGHPPEGD